jgi:hypothetical protein
MNAEDSATKKDLEGLQGTWSLLSAMEDGKSLAEHKVKQTTIVIKDDTFTSLTWQRTPLATRGLSSSTRRKSRNRCIAAVAEVTRTEDIGLDAIATLLRLDNDGNLYAEDSFVVQLKADSVTSIQYQDHELEWL